MTDPILIDNRYRPIRPLGRGMSGEVFLVDDGGRAVALKFLNTVQLNVKPQEALQNFKNEFSILKGLTHPNIADIIDFGYDEEKRKYYFTAEHIDGAELHKACGNESFATKEALLVQILRALNYLHARGIMHFDVKPQNILVTRRDGGPDRAKLIDFGLASYKAHEKKAGTPAYMAPEVIRGGVLDARSDLYSFGAVAYFVLTGVNPFAGKTLPETLDRQLNSVPARASSVNPDVPEYWDAVLARLLEKDPALRPSQASLVIRDLGFFSGKSFDVETEDSKLSYLPERGTLIGRDGAWRKFLEIFGAVFVEEAPATARLLAVEGAKGTGKSRLAAEIKFHAQLKGIPVLAWREYAAGRELPERFLLIADEPEIRADEINAVLQQSLGRRGLVVWAAESASLPIGGETIRLGNYSAEELRLYLESVTGLARAPEKLIREVLARTQGNPFLVTEFVKALLKKDLLFDAAGKWDAATLEDFSVDFSSLAMPSTIEESLKAVLASLTRAQRDIVTWLAVNEAPLTPAGISRLRGVPSEIDAMALLQAGFAEFSPRGELALKNPYLGELARLDLEVGEKKSRHARLALLHAEEHGGERTVLFHEGFAGDGAQATEVLRRLAGMCRDEADYAGAVRFYREAARRESGTAAILELAKALAACGRHEEAAAEARKIPPGGEADVALESLALRVDAAFKRCDLGEMERGLAEVERCLEEAKPLTGRSSLSRAWHVLFGNHAAFLKLKRGDLEGAIADYAESHRIWRDDFSPAERDIAGNNRLVEALTAGRDFTRAIEAGLETVRLLENSPRRYILAVHRYALANAYHQLLMSEKRPDADEIAEKCLHHYRLAGQTARESSHHGLMLRAYNGMGLIALYRGDEKSALEHYERALTLARKTGEMRMAGLLAYNIAAIHKDRDRPREALSYVVYAVNTLARLPMPTAHDELVLYHAHLVWADAEVSLGGFDEAERAASRAEAIMEKSSLARSHASRLYLLKARAGFLRDDVTAAQDWLKRARETAVTPEQKGTVEKFMGSAEYKKIVREKGGAA